MTSPVQRMSRGRDVTIHSSRESRVVPLGMSVRSGIGGKDVAESVALGLVTARVASIARQVLLDRDLTDPQRDALGELSSGLRSEAEILEGRRPRASGDEQRYSLAAGSGPSLRSLVQIVAAQSGQLQPRTRSEAARTLVDVAKLLDDVCRGDREAAIKASELFDQISEEIDSDVRATAFPSLRV